MIPQPAAVWKALARKLSQPGRERIKVFDPETKEYLKTRRITDTLPTLMAAVYLYNKRRTTLLALDFDSKTHGRDQVDADFERARAWLTACGARLITDRSTNGGRHVLIPLAIGTTASFDEIQPLMRQLQVRLPSLDIKPMQNPNEGCISLPGTPCAGGGYRILDGPLVEAVNAVTERSAPTLLPELYALMGTLPSPAGPATTSTPTRPRPTTGTGEDERLIEQFRFTKPFPADVAAFAAAGTIHLPKKEKKKGRAQYQDRGRCPRQPGCWQTPSEARMSVVLQAVLRGYSHAAIREASRPGGPWQGLGDSYRSHDAHHPDAHLARDVSRALHYTATIAGKANQPAHRHYYSHGAGAVEGPLGRWLAYALAWADYEFTGSPLRWTVRDVFQALAIKAAVAGKTKLGTPVVGVGGRSLSLSAGLTAPTTVFDVLRRTRDMVGSPIMLVRPRVGRDPDFYALTTSNPDNIIPVPLERIRLTDVHPAWSVLSRRHRLVHDLIVHTGMTRPADIYAAARVSARTGQLSIAALVTAGLVTRKGRSVGPGPATLDDIAAAHHLDEAVEEWIARFRRERAAWHDWLDLQDRLRGLAVPRDAGEPSTVPAEPGFDDHDEYLAAVLSTGPPETVDDEELAALDLLADLLGARVLAPAGRE